MPGYRIFGETGGQRGGFDTSAHPGETVIRGAIVRLDRFAALAMRGLIERSTLMAFPAAPAAKKPPYTPFSAPCNARRTERPIFSSE